jgi:hypothetical protein
MRSLAARLVQLATTRLPRRVPNTYSLIGVLRCGNNSASYSRHDFSTVAEDSYSSSSSENVTVTNGRTVSISLSSNTSRASTFHAPWLWVNDPNFAHPTSGQKLRTLGNYPKTRKIIQAQIILVEGVDVDYPPSPPGSFHSRGGIYDDHHVQNLAIDDNDNAASNSLRSMLQIMWDDEQESLYDLEWLARCSYDTPTTTTSNTRITKDLAIGAHADNDNNTDCVPIPTFDYEEIMTVPDGCFRALHGIMQHGAILVKSAPSIEHDLASTVALLGKHLAGGSLSHGSLYGDTFHVQCMREANNIAYTSEALPPHQDLTYYESKPFLQLLHCVSSAGVGGESVLIDSMAAAEELRHLAPDLFDTLCQAEATFLKQRQGADMVSFKPHIVTSNDDEVVAVHWSPPFEGPLQISPDMIDDYVMAYQAMACLLDNRLENNSTLLPPALEQELRDYAQWYTWEYALRPGEILVFNNQRMLHGRRAFSLQGDGQRHLIGCYTDVMETTNQYRLLLRQRGGRSHPIRDVGNGSRGSSLSFVN